MKIKEEQLKVIQDNQKKLTEIIYEIGVLETTKHGLAHKIADINLEVDAFKEELEKEYGAININIETGEYTKIEKEPELSKVD